MRWILCVPENILPTLVYLISIESIDPHSCRLDFQITSGNQVVLRKVSKSLSFCILAWTSFVHNLPLAIEGHWKEPSDESIKTSVEIVSKFRYSQSQLLIQFPKSNWCDCSPLDIGYHSPMNHPTKRPHTFLRKTPLSALQWWLRPVEPTTSRHWSTTFR